MKLLHRLGGPLLVVYLALSLTDGLLADILAGLVLGLGVWAVLGETP